MLGIGYFGSAADEDEWERLPTQLRLRSPVGIACSKHRRFPKGAAPRLGEFRHDKFLSFDPQYGHESEDFVGGLVGLSLRSER